jgi:hypothetical protein
MREALFLSLARPLKNNRSRNDAKLDEWLLKPVARVLASPETGRVVASRLISCNTCVGYFEGCVYLLLE